MHKGSRNDKNHHWYEAGYNVRPAYAMAGAGLGCVMPCLWHIAQLKISFHSFRKQVSDPGSRFLISSLKPSALPLVVSGGRPLGIKGPTAEEYYL